MLPVMYTSRSVFSIRLIKLLHPDLLNPQQPSVFLLSNDNAKTVAREVLTEASAIGYVDEIHITSTYIVIQIDKVVVPRVIMTQHCRQPLNKFRAVPFYAVCYQNCICIASIPIPVQSPYSPSLHTTNHSATTPMEVDPDDEPDGISLNDMLCSDLWILTQSLLLSSNK